MWGRRRRPRTARGGTLETLVGRDTTLRGDVEFRGGMVIEGRVAGNVSARGGATDSLTLTRYGVIEGDVRAPHQTLDGTVVGDVYAALHVMLGAHARINGNVYYGRLDVAGGAEVNGSLVHRPDLASLPALTPPPARRVLLAEPLEGDDPEGL